jgi:signal transduction histidine kinase/pSer/pThr/pTyr-binding forkhead associated (FHA) protein
MAPQSLRQRYQTHAALRGEHGLRWVGNAAHTILGVLVLSVIQGPNKGRKFELPDHEPQLIGRSSEALHLDDNAISRRHAELTPDEGLWYLRDLQSQNGTYVNGQRIHDRTRLRPGDQVRVGQTLMVFGQTETRSPDVVRVVGPQRMDSTIEKSLPSRAPAAPSSKTGENDDSMILAVPEPRAAAQEHLRVIYRLTTMLTTRAMDRAEVLEVVMDLVFSEFAPQRGCIMVSQHASPDQQTPGAGTTLSESLGVFLPAVVRYREAPLDPEDAKINVSRTILQHALAKGEGVLSTNAMTDPRFAKGDSVQRGNVRSALCSPVRFRDTTYGAVYIDSSMANYTFTPEQLALLNAIGQHAGLALANADLYQQKLRNERLAVMGETVATLSHSIKNILQGMRGGADVVEMGLKKHDLKVASGGWPILKRNLDRIISLTMNMLAFSRPRRAELELAPLTPLIEDCAELLQPACDAKQATIIVDVDSGVPPAPIDPALMHQALMNLLTNAVEAVPAGEGVVTVRARYFPQAATAPTRLPTGGPVIEIAVIDNGPGIPRSKHPWIFEPFNTTKGVKGTGLGLAVARRVAHQHSGTLTLDPDQGRGATFRLTLPLEGHATLDPSATAHSRAHADGAGHDESP